MKYRFSMNVIASPPSNLSPLREIVAQREAAAMAAATSRVTNRQGAPVFCLLHLHENDRLAHGVKKSCKFSCPTTRPLPHGCFGKLS